MDFQINPINDVLDFPDINKDVYETIKRTGGQMSLHPLVFLYFYLINDYLQ